MRIGELLIRHQGVTAEAVDAALEEQVREESPNGLGLEGCSTGIIVNLQLDRIVAKAE